MDLVRLVAICAAGLSVAGSDCYAGELESVPLGAVAKLAPATDDPEPGWPPLSLVDRWRSSIAAASRRFGIPAAWIRAVMQAESGGRTTLNGRPITSPAGAMGLMQVMPATYDAMRQRYGLGAHPHDPQDNIFAGAAYLREMYKRYGYPGLFAAYNAGPARFDAHLRHGQPLPPETQRYLAALDLTSAEGPVRAAWSSGRTLFFALGASPLAVPSRTADPADLFVPLTKDRLVLVPPASHRSSGNGLLYIRRISPGPGSNGAMHGRQMPRQGKAASADGR